MIGTVIEVTGHKPFSLDPAKTNTSQIMLLLSTNNNNDSRDCRSINTKTLKYHVGPWGHLRIGIIIYYTSVVCIISNKK